MKYNTEYYFFLKCMSFISFIRSEAKFYNEFYEVLQVLHVLLGFVWRAYFFGSKNFFLGLYVHSSFVLCLRREPLPGTNDNRSFLQVRQARLIKGPTARFYTPRCLRPRGNLISEGLFRAPTRGSFSMLSLKGAGRNPRRRRIQVLQRRLPSIGARGGARV